MPLIVQWISEHSLWLLLGIGTVFTCVWLLKYETALKIHWQAAVLFSILHTAAGVISVKAFAVAETGFDFSTVGNMSLFGGVFFMPVLYYAAAKLSHRNVSTVFDVCTISMVFTVMCARINCLLAGCCFGNRIPGLSLRWPTRELEIIFYIILLVVLGKKVNSGNTDGIIYPLYMVFYGVFRFIIEGFRYNSNGNYFHLGHLWALISVFLGVSFYTGMKKKGRKRRYA